MTPKLLSRKGNELKNGQKPEAANGKRRGELRGSTILFLEYQEREYRQRPGDKLRFVVEAQRHDRSRKQESGAVPEVVGDQKTGEKKKERHVVRKRRNAVIGHHAIRQKNQRAQPRSKLAAGKPKGEQRAT